MDASRKYILSIDGGGIKGIIPLCMLARLEDQTGQRAGDVFDFLAGTSTGAIIAAGLLTGKSAHEILDLYVTFGTEIFPPAFPGWYFVKRLVLGYMYSVKNLRDVIARHAGAQATSTLNELDRDVLVTAVRAPDVRAWYFVKDQRDAAGNPINACTTGGLCLVDCVAASAAAPTYFGPWSVPVGAAWPLGNKDKPDNLVDGGVGTAGNPTYQACVEAFDWTGGRYAPQETTVVSLGTGRYVEPNLPRAGLIPPWRGIRDWAYWVLGALLDSPDEEQTELVHRNFHRPNLGRMFFYRLNPTLDEQIDLADAAEIPKLRRIGEAFALGIDWPAILAGTDEEFLVTDHKTRPYQYSKRVAMPSS
jgi:predicted acylesterase/phospholipase RssA